MFMGNTSIPALISSTFFSSYRSALKIFLFRIPNKSLHSFIYDSQVCPFHLVIQKTITNKFRGQFWNLHILV